MRTAFGARGIRGKLEAGNAQKRDAIWDQAVDDLGSHHDGCSNVSSIGCAASPIRLPVRCRARLPYLWNAALPGCPGRASTTSWRDHLPRELEAPADCSHERGTGWCRWPAAGRG